MSKKSKNKNLYFFADVKLVFVRRTHHFDTFFSFWFVDTFSFSISALFSSRLSRLCDSFLSPPHRRHWLMWLIQSIPPPRLSIFFVQDFLLLFPLSFGLVACIHYFFLLESKNCLEGFWKPLNDCLDFSDPVEMSALPCCSCYSAIRHLTFFFINFFALIFAFVVFLLVFFLTPRKELKKNRD